MKKFRRLLVALGKWTVVTLLLVEIGCFLLITVTNLVLFGSIWKGSQVRYDPYAGFLNLKGVQPTAHNPSNQEGKARHIWMLGGSTTRCEKVRPEQSIASFLARRLNEPDGQQPAVVTNYGENTFNSVLELKYLQKLLMESHCPPDLIIFYDGANDCIYFNEYRNPHAHYGYRRLQGPVESYRRSSFGLLKPFVAALYASFTLETMDRLRQTLAPLHPDDRSLLEECRAVSRRYDHARRLASAYGAGFLVIWQPLLWVETGQVADRVRQQEQRLAIMDSRFLHFKKNFAMIYRTLANHLENKPYFVNFQNILCGRTEPVYEADGVHLNAAGNRLVAEAMAPLVKGGNW
ncbi:MAG: SGNH/GDSL hydrolase family protein [Desulfobaccales bacterium]